MGCRGLRPNRNFAAMVPECVYVASDVHLGAGTRRRERIFADWLEHAAERADEIVLNGDLFDFWFEYGTVIPRGHTRVLGTLANVVDAGVPVRMVGGNHDWWGSTYLTDEIGVTFHRDPIRISLAGWHTLVAHGDGLGSGDRGYRLLRGLIRHPVTCALFRWLHPDVGARLARAASRTESREEGDPRAWIRTKALEEWASARLAAEPDLDLILLGHTHVPLLKEVSRNRYYVNSGDWLQHRSYVVLSADAPPRIDGWGTSAGEQEAVG